MLLAEKCQMPGWQSKKARGLSGGHIIPSRMPPPSLSTANVALIAGQISLQDPPYL